ncbi:MAG TPA: MazG family protein [Mycobacteriales bacterium]|nr:MazG family protein [Mycobacteriales bacterium]
MSRLVLLLTSPRVAAGLLCADAWVALRAGPVFVGDLESPDVEVLTAAGVATRLSAAAGSMAIAAELVDAADETGTVTRWLGADEHATQLAEDVAASLASADDTAGIDVDVVCGSWDLPGARLLDVVATVDRLRSPGGCPWDARQDHQSLAPYLLEEAYEAFQAIEDADTAGLREEIGDVLFQVAFHARLAEELPAEQRWTVDDVANGLVDKLRRRHPHVFDGLEVSGEADVNADWETIKATERGDASVVSNVALAAPALTLAATLQRKAARVGSFDPPARSLSEPLADFKGMPSAESAGELLWATVVEMSSHGIDAEAALRARARRFRDEVATSDSRGRAARLPEPAG